jgi:RNA polymerase primary sigma factor
MATASILSRDHSQRRGDAWRLSESEPLTRDELSQAIRRYRENGDVDAGQRVVRSHLRLVASIAQRFARPSVSIDDLMVEGALALLKALDSFDETRGTSFTSYASVAVTFVIRSEARTHHDTVRVPTRDRRHAAARTWADSMACLRYGKGGAPADGQPTGPDAISQRTASLAGPTQGCVSMSLPDDQGGARSMPLADDHPSPCEQAMARDEMRRVHAALDSLSSQPAEALRLRFGLDGESPHGMADTARLLHMTTHAAALMIDAGLRQLRLSLATREQ